MTIVNNKDKVKITIIQRELTAMKNYQNVLSTFERKFLEDIEKMKKEIVEAIEEKDFVQLKAGIEEFIKFGNKTVEAYSGKNSDNFKKFFYHEYYREVEAILAEFDVQASIYGGGAVLSHKGVPIAVHPFREQKAIPLVRVFQIELDGAKNILERYQERLQHATESRDLMHAAIYNPEAFKTNQKLAPNLFSDDKKVRKEEAKLLKELLKNVKKQPDMANQKLKEAEEEVLDYQESIQDSEQRISHYTEKIDAVKELDVVIEALKKAGIEMNVDEKIDAYNGFSFKDMGSKELNKILGFFVYND